MQCLMWIVLVACVYPALGSLTPRLGLPLLTTDGKDFTQTCSLDVPGSVLESPDSFHDLPGSSLDPKGSPGPVFTLTWRFDSQVYKTVLLTPGVYNDSLTSSDWTGHLGETLSCSVAEQGNFSSINSSNPFLGNIFINPSNLTLHEGETAVLNITSTLPIVCPHLPLVLCNMQLNMSVTGGFPGDLLGTDTCSVPLKGTDWDPVSGTASETAVIATVVDPVLKPDTLHHVAFTVEPNSLLHTMWTDYTSNEAEVEVIDEPYQTCIVTGDWYVVTANGNSVVLHKDQGDFLLLKASTQDGHRIQIQVRKDILGRTCGIALNVDSSLIIINSCFKHSLTAPLLTQGTDRPNDLKIYLCGDEYQIVTGDGIQLVVADISGAYDFKISIPSLYQFAENSSLCTHNGNTSIIYLKTSELFRLSRQDSLFDLGHLVFYKSNTSTSTKPNYYSCPEGNTAYGFFQRSRNPMSPIEKGDHCRLVQPHDYDPLLTKTEKHGAIHLRPHATKNYSALCESRYHSLTPDVCQSLDLNLAHVFIRECSGENMYTVRGPKEILWACEERLFGNFSNYRQDGSGELQPVDALGSLTCPSECYFHGKCVAGKCICHPPWKWTSTCQMNVVIHLTGSWRLSFRGGPICDTSKTRCDEIIIMVPPNSFNADNVKASAKISLLQFQEGRFIPGSLIFHVDAFYETYRTIFVSLKDILKTLSGELVTGLMISLTLDGKTFSRTSGYYIYDGRCQNCFQNAIMFGGGGPICLFREDACTINNKCYHAREINPKDNTQMCNPDRKLKQWSPVN